MIDKLKYWHVERFLNKTGAGFCLDKWHASTLHLATGMEHGCHHPNPVKINADELTTPDKLFNHSHKLAVRQQMLDGIKPAECAYCWKSNSTQDRIIHSSKGYNWHNRNISGTHSIPKYLEVSFGNACNLGCAYCGPSFSSVWQQEIENQGAYPDGHLQHYVNPIPNNQHNPYIEAFWKLWPTLQHNLEHLRITGGEPLMSKHTYRILEQAKDIAITVNTNLSVTDDLLEKFCNSAKNIQNLTISVSGESTGARAEYARHGLNYEKFLYNLQVVQNRLPTARLQIMSTYNCLCVTTFKDFLQDVKHCIPDVMLSVNRLQSPDFFDHRLLDRELKYDALDYIKHNFNKEAYVRFDNIINDDLLENAETLRLKLRKFVQEFDRRRNTNFVQTFPELQ